MKIFGKSDEKKADELSGKRHSLAHVLAAAVLELYPESENAIGPAIDNGFYYDFEIKGDLSDKDLPKIEQKMREIIKGWTDFKREEVTAKEARMKFADNSYKLELINDFAEDGKNLTLYTSGGFPDLCKGGHTNNPSKDIKADAFKLERVAGAYWKGDENNKMLTRIYGLAFDKKEELDEYLANQEEAKKRDHRKIGKELDLFIFSDLVGPGLPLFTPQGALVRDLITERLQSIRKRLGYSKVTIPHITKKELYEVSGHWDKFKDDLFHVRGASDTEFVMKPMNCPHHNELYARKVRSYKEMPVRFSEPTMVYRDEQAGELLGLARVRAITQDDGHVYARPDQIKQEIKNLLGGIKELYTAAGLLNEDNYFLSLSLRDPENPDKYLGQVENWESAEKTLEEIAQEEKLEYRKIIGEAAFYGPKLDFQFIDVLGRERQLATVQLDFVQPERFKLYYVDKDGSHQQPAMIHAAISGSLERFMAILLEHTAGNLPTWLSPVQVKVLPITDTQMKFAEEVAGKLSEAGYRAKVDSAAESLGKKIRQAKVEKVPYLLVIGEKEMKDQKIKVESRDEGDLGLMSTEEFINHLGEK